MGKVNILLLPEAIGVPTDTPLILIALAVTLVIGSLNVMTIFPVLGGMVAPVAGVVLTNVGGVLSANVEN